MISQQIAIKIKPKNEMRYNTVGDYFFLEDGTLQFEIADTGVPLFNKMILIHEIAEQALSEYRGIPNEEIDEFDFKYEMEREKGQHGETEEPGFDRECPIQKEHTFATSVEMMMCALAGVAWKDYDDHINSL